MIGFGQAEGDVVGRVEGLDEGAERLGIGRGVALDGDEQRAVGARTESLGEHVVGLADRLVLRIVAGIAETQADREQRDGEQEQETGGDDGTPAGATLDEAAPPVPDLLLLGLLRAVGNRGGAGA